MKKVLILLLTGIFALHLNAQNRPDVNYDESKVPVYKLPDPLIFNDGSKVSNRNDWGKRRPEIMRLFENEVYGISPEWKGEIKAERVGGNSKALGGKAIRKDIKLTLVNGNKSIDILVLVYLPPSKKPVPVFLGYNFYGNHAVTIEPDIPVTASWMRDESKQGIVGNKATGKARGTNASAWQVEEIVKRGYGLVTVYYGDVDPDYDDGFKNGVHSLYEHETTSTSWGSISAWAWGLSRVMDWIETDSEIDSKKVAVMGHSRLGKTSLWAGAVDQRFAMVISNNSGCGGAALSKRKYGETVNIINTAFPHWFCDNFNKYNNKEETLPVDQHELLALIAPRPVYVASAQDDQWADPKGEFLACVAAAPVYKLLGEKPFVATDMPAVNSPLMSIIGYHIRTGEHAVKLYDWQQYLNFADLHFKK